MDKEKFYIDLTIGRRIFDTSKQSEWTIEEWLAWIGEPENHAGLAFNLLEDDTLHLNVSSIYYNESNNHMYVVFEATNKYEQDITLESGTWKVDDTFFELPNMLPIHIKANELKSDIEGNVAYMFMQDTICMEFSIFEAKTRKLMRELAFEVKVYH